MLTSEQFSLIDTPLSSEIAAFTVSIKNAYIITAVFTGFKSIHGGARLHRIENARAERQFALFPASSPTAPATSQGDMHHLTHTQTNAEALCSVA